MPYLNIHSIFHAYGLTACETCRISQACLSILHLILSIYLPLNSLGNTCYMNATVQALRAIPELQVALSA